MSQLRCLNCGNVTQDDPRTLFGVEDLMATSYSADLYIPEQGGRCEITCGKCGLRLVIDMKVAITYDVWLEGED